MPSLSKFNFKFGVKKRLRTHPTTTSSSSPPPLLPSLSKGKRHTNGVSLCDDNIDELFTEGGGKGTDAVTNSPIVDRKKKGKTEKHLGELRFA